MSNLWTACSVLWRHIPKSFLCSVSCLARQSWVPLSKEGYKQQCLQWNNGLAANGAHLFACYLEHGPCERMISPV
jgi:hypothetical protein